MKKNKTKEEYKDMFSEIEANLNKLPFTNHKQTNYADHTNPANPYWRSQLRDYLRPRVDARARGAHMAKQQAFEGEQVLCGDEQALIAALAVGKDGKVRTSQSE